MEIRRDPIWGGRLFSDTRKKGTKKVRGRKERELEFKHARQEKEGEEENKLLCRWGIHSGKGKTKKNLRRKGSAFIPTEDSHARTKKERGSGVGTNGSKG